MRSFHYRQQSQTLANKRIKINLVYSDKSGIRPYCGGGNQRIGLELAFSTRRIEKRGSQGSVFLIDVYNAVLDKSTSQVYFIGVDRTDQELVPHH
jgi:hypothetical protein